MTRTIRLGLGCLLLMWQCLVAIGQNPSTTFLYDEEDGLPHGHVTQLLQDECGFMWFATWNGLCRYDGYEFQTFKAQVGDGCHMVTDRYRDIALRPDGQIVCRVDDGYFLFDTHTCRFRDMTPEEAQQAPDDLKQYRQSKRNGSFYCTDRQGNQWSLVSNGITKTCATEQISQRLDIEPKAHVKCLFTDHQQRCWIATKDDGALRLYRTEDLSFLGYLGADGNLHSNYTRFGAPVYCMFQSEDGTLWLGSKPDGLFRLKESSPNQFRVERLTGLPDPNVYDLLQDRSGRLWVATLGGGLYYSTEAQSEQPRFEIPTGYPSEVAQRVRYLHISSDGCLMAATTEGLVIAKLEPEADSMRFRLHQREADRAESLSSSATMDIAEDSQGRLFVSTESGGFNLIETSDLTSDQLRFSHYTADNHRLPNDVVLSLTTLDNNRKLVVGSHLITLLDSIGNQRILDARHFLSDYRFSEAHPQQLADGSWLFGLLDGAITIPAEKMYRQTYDPQIMLTGISIQGGEENRAVAYLDTLTLRPNERNLTIRFAAIDYSASEHINYAFRLQPDTTWNFIGHDRSVFLLDLEPQTYRLEIRSTNGDGQWTDQIRMLTIIAQPTFWESALGRLLILLLTLGSATIVIYTLLYIRNIKRKHRETLNAYLALLETRDESDNKPSETLSDNSRKSEYDPMLKRVMAFIEENISNENASVGDMASAAATSRSGLQRKLKQAMGITPQDLMREARIKHACMLLRESEKSVSEIAYACGFSDPKYFSRCFKQSIGQTPSEYKTNPDKV